MRENHLIITRIDGDYNYEIASGRGAFIARVNWLNVGGARLGFDDGEVEIGGPVELDLANSNEKETRGAGAYITRVE